MNALWDSLHCWFDEPTTTEAKSIDSGPRDLQDTVRRLQIVLAHLQEEDGIVISYL